MSSNAASLQYSTIAKANKTKTTCLSTAYKLMSQRPVAIDYNAGGLLQRRTDRNDI